MDSIPTKVEEFIRPLRYVTMAQLMAFCGKRTPCNQAWQTVRDIFVKIDRRAASRRVFAAGFALGVEWYRQNSKSRTKALADRISVEADRQGEEMFHKARLDMLR